MKPLDIDRELTRDPFVPIRVLLADGHGYEVRNRRRCMIVHGTLYVASVDNPSRVADDMDIIDCAQIIRVEQMNEPVDPTIAARSPLNRKTTTCSFCGHSNTERGPMLEGPGNIFMCEVCVEIAHGTVLKMRGQRELKAGS